MFDFESMNTNSLKEIYNQIDAIITKREVLRQKELWGNVVAAVKKYIEEFDEEIEIRIDEETFNEKYLDEPGKITYPC